MQPRNYQKEALNAIKEKRDNGDHSALIVMATGLGKTMIYDRPMRPLSYLSPKQYLEQYKNKKLK